MVDKQWHRDRIKELEIKRTWYYDIQKIIVTIMVGFGAIYMAMLSIY